MWMGRFLEAPEVESWLPGELTRWLACWNSWLHTPNPNVQGWERGWKLNQSIANDYWCHYQWHLHRETSRKAKRTEFRGCLDEWTHGEVGRMTPLPTLLPCLPLGCYWIISFYNKLVISSGFPGGTSGKEPACQCRRLKRHRFNPWVGKTPPGGGHGNPLQQYSCLENPMDRRARWVTVHRVSKSQTQPKWLSTHTCMVI